MIQNLLKQIPLIRKVEEGLEQEKPKEEEENANFGQFVSKGEIWFPLLKQIVGAWSNLQDELEGAFAC